MTQKNAVRWKNGRLGLTGFLQGAQQKFCICTQPPEVKNKYGKLYVNAVSYIYDIY
jgi:hypothetical protein